MTPGSPQRNRQRLAYYLMGVALGCILLGIYVQGRRAFEERRRQAEMADEQREQAAQPAAPAADDGAVQRAAPSGPPSTPAPAPPSTPR